MSLITPCAMHFSRSLSQKSGFYTRTTIRQIHSQHNPMPFSSENRRLFAVKCLLYMGTGFSVPFIASWWHIHRTVEK
ncbi:hypothetical protein CPB83DRAFT_861137 [Crepidotus variabilis]|uniref:Cytochrome c oxidase subunit 8, mitochondrial n=1 Tax=Crepidotus variabilis TaxID=179855 RepID=A0A9P6E8T8_9AGAR|nr:hypothetical protein CPB83DRAFT_861137 [Crepidotus variabilis]